MSNHNPIVSIIVPVYNSAQFIEDCINSIISQTYQYIECILIDDQSKDDSIAICQNILSSYSGHIRFRIVSHSQNMGCSAARNTGINHSTGDYVYFLDSDDCISHNCISLFVEELNKYPNCEMITAYRCTDQLDESIFHKYIHFEDNASIRLGYLSLDRVISIEVTNKLISKQFLTNNNLYFEVGLLHEDLLWNYFAIKKLQQVSIIQNITYLYKSNPTSITNGTTRTIRGPHYMRILEKMLASLDSPHKKVQLYHIVCIFLNWYNSVPRNEYISISKTIVKELKKNNLIACAILHSIFFNIRGFKRFKFILKTYRNFIISKYRKYPMKQTIS